MFKLSRRSYDRLTGVDQRLIYLADEVIKITPIDFGIAYLGGRRTAEEQNQLFLDGNSQKDGMTDLSKQQLGQALDILPFVNGKVNLDEWSYAMILSAFYIKAKELEIKIRFGANWNGDNIWIKGQSFIDLPHIEINN